ncbi:hypothetical protein V865_002341 [Kwoniella europaea PYCC6329]|uniref:SCP domain-containing protein n=1 Tax=Kwoniella europaea PYCC6329 TaxID=1423913 RepID=A0AAX4KE41_9TREE
MLRLTLLPLLTSLLVIPHGVNAVPHCRPHHNHSVSTVTQWYTRHHPQSTTVLSSTIPTTSAQASSDTSLVIEDPTSSDSADPTFVLVSSTSSTSEQPVPTSTLASVEQSSVPESSTSTAATEVAPSITNLAAQPTSSSVSNTTSGGSGSGTSDPDADLLVKLHNDFRAQYGAGTVTWSTTLADYAKSHATACNMEHTNGPYGENLAAGAGGGYTITDGFNAWADEASEYDPSNPQYSHFTQVVWKATTEIGCAAVTCLDGTIFSDVGSDSLYIMCEYNPPGNVIGQFAENVGSKTS